MVPPAQAPRPCLPDAAWDAQAFALSALSSPSHCPGHGHSHRACSFTSTPEPWHLLPQKGPIVPFPLSQKVQALKPGPQSCPSACPCRALHKCCSCIYRLSAAPPVSHTLGLWASVLASFSAGNVLWFSTMSALEPLSFCVAEHTKSPGRLKPSWVEFRPPEDIWKFQPQDLQM